MSRTDQLFTDGAAYERLMGRWSRRAGDVFLAWLDAPKHLRWLDVGCGTGVFTEQIVRECSPATVTGIDPSPEQVAFASERPGLSTAEFRVGDGQELPFAEESFDVATMALVVHFLADPARAVAEAARVVSRDGWAAAYAWDFTRAGSPTAPIGAAMKAMGLEPPAPPSPHATSCSALEELWRAAGFEDIETRTIDVSVEFADFDAFWDSMTLPVGPGGKAIAQMSPDMRQRLHRVLQEQMPADATGRVAYKAVASAVKGRKRA